MNISIPFDPSNIPSNAPPAQVEAIRIAIEGNWLERVALRNRAGAALLRNPNDTEQVFLLGAVAGRKRFPALLARFVTSGSGLELLERDATIDRKHVDYAALRKLPADSLGGAYVRMLDEEGLDPDLFQAPPGLPRALAYVAKRLRQTHDLWHLVTGYGTDVHSEIALQAFSYGQTGMPLSRLITIFGLLRWGFAKPALWAQAWRAYRAGQQACFLATFDWEAHWEQPLDKVRQKLNVTRLA
jgi:ubiquinone biosynthesis protein COQ4